MWIFLALPSLILVITYPFFRQKIQIWLWRRNLRLNKHEIAFNELFANVDGFSLSKVARVKQDALEYVYGEIEFTSFIALLSLTKPNADSVFYDLGSGTGKAVIACAMVFHMRKCVGFEWFQSLHKAACVQQQQLSAIPEYSFLSHTVQFIHADFLTADFYDATLIFINATAFFGETWVNLSNHLGKKTNNNVTIISTSKALKSPLFSIIKTVIVQMSWGCVTAYIQRRIA